MPDGQCTAFSVNYIPFSFNLIWISHVSFHWLTSCEFRFTNYFHCRFYRKQVHSGALVQTVSSHVILAYYIIPTSFCQLFLAGFHHFFVGIFYSISFRLSTVSSAFTSVILPLSRHSTNLYTRSGSNCLPAS